MNVTLILSLALVLLASVTFAAPSRVVLPADAYEDLNTKGKAIQESFLGWKRSLPAHSDSSLLAYSHFLQQQKRELSAEQQEGGPEVAGKQERESYIEEETWYPPTGPSPFEDIEIEDDPQQVAPVISDAEDVAKRWETKINELFESDEKREYEADEQPIDDVQRSVDDEGEPQIDPSQEEEPVNDEGPKINPLQEEEPAINEEPANNEETANDEEPKINPLQVASEFGLTEEQLEELYRLWFPKVPAGEDSSFEAFVTWMYENNDPEGTATDRRPTYIRWGWKIANWYRNRQADENTGPEEQQLAEVQRSYEEDQPLIDLEEAAKGYEEADPAAGENFEQERQQSFEPDMERREGEEQGEGIQPDPEEVVEPQGESTPLPVQEEEQPQEEQFTPFPVQEEEEEPQEDPTPVPVEEQEEEAEESPDTIGGYSCETNSPCNIENIANEQFYFATASAYEFIQCDAWGGCHTKNCDDGLVWNDVIKTCGQPT